MNGILIAIIIIMVVLNFFMVMIIGRIVFTVGKEINKDTYKAVLLYENAIEKKATELEKLERAAQRHPVKAEKSERETPRDHVVQKQVQTNSSRDGKYNNDGFTQSYKSIQKTFKMFDECKLKQLVDGLTQGETANNTAKNILDKVSFKNLYQLAMMDNETQIKILLEIFDEVERNILNQYIIEHDGFDCLGFFDFLTIKAKIDQEDICVQTPNNNLFSDTLKDKANIVLDENLCEGFQILHKGKLYDFAISDREIN